MKLQLEENQGKQLKRLLQHHKELFKDTPGHTMLAEHKIPTGDARPVRLPPYRIPHVFRDTVKTELNEMLTAGLISHSSSEWSSPIVLVKKKDGTMRLCVDYRRLNSCSRTDAYPMPRVDELIVYLYIGLDSWILAGARSRARPSQDCICHTIWTVSVQCYAVWITRSTSYISEIDGQCTHRTGWLRSSLLG